MNDVMVFTPVNRLEPETVQAIFSLEWDGALSILLQRDNPAKLPLGVAPSWDWDNEEERKVGMENHLHQYQRGREIFLASPCEAMLVIESDVIPPEDTLKRLAALDCDLAYGCYMFRSIRPVVNVLERYTAWPDQSKNMGESLMIKGLWAAAVAQGIIECSGCGLGCVLIKRQVLEEVPFEKNGFGFVDWEWTEKVYKKNYRMMADTRVICGHKTPDGRVLWPS